MDDEKNDVVAAGAAKSIDPAAIEMLAHADECGIETAFSRADHMKPCPIGESGACCRICSMGPCRLVGKDAEEKTGICGADMGTIASRHFARQVAGGVAAHSDHGRDMAMTLRAVAKGEAAGYTVKDEQKLHSVAGYMGIPTAGREVNEIALDVADKALEQFGQSHGEIIYTKRATLKRQAKWRELGLTPRAIDREVVEIMHRTHEGVDLDAENILKSALRCSLADGWGGAMLSTDISDILFGTPSPLASEVNLGVLKSDQVNVIVHGHEPTLSAMLVEAARDPELIAEARAAGAEGINLAGICCTSNEILMRYGIPAAGNFLHQELAVLTGAVETMVVDVQCIMQALGPLAQRFHTQLVTTSPKAKIQGAVHVEFDEHRAPETAREIVRMAIANYPNRGPIHIPDFHEPLVAGFSHEYLNYMQGGFHRGSFRPLNDAIIAGRIRGLAGVVGCNNVRVTQDEGIVDMIKRFIADDVMVVVTGCAATAGAKAGYLSPEILDHAGPGLREVMEAIGIPPVLHLGSCVDNSRILTVLTQVATEGGLGEDIDDLPAVGLCPEWMCEKAIAIGTYFAASGAHVIFGVSSPVKASSEATRLMTTGWEAMVGGDLEFIPDWDEMYARSLELIDAKREALKLPQYDPAQFGASGDSMFFAAIKEYLAEKAAEQERGLETVGSPVYPLAEGHSHDPGERAPARRTAATGTRTARGRPDVALHRHARDPRRQHHPGRGRDPRERGRRRARPRDAGGVHQHRLLPAGGVRLHRRQGADARRPAGRHRARQGARAPRAGQPVLAAVPGRDAGQRRGHPLRRGGHRGRALRPPPGAADPAPRPRRQRRRALHRRRPAGARRQDEAQRPHRRHPAARLGHPAGGRAHARVLRHRGLRQEQRGRRQDRARAAEPRHPHLPQRQRQRAQHHPPAAGRGHPARLRHLHGAVRRGHHLRRVRARVRGPLGPHLRRHGAGPGARHHALQQVPRVRLRAGPRRGGRPQVRHRRRRHQLRLPHHRRHAHPADPAHRRDHLRARREHAVRRDPRRRRHGEDGEAHPALHRGARRQGAHRQGAHPGELRLGL